MSYPVPLVRQSCVPSESVTFEALYARHADGVRRLCRRMVKDPQWADELTQDVFVRVWNKLHLFRGDSAFATWLHQLATNVVRNALKRRTLELDRLSDVPMESLAARTATPLDRIDLENAVVRLPRRAQLVFVLYEMEGYKHKEIAHMLGITSAYTRNALWHSRRRLRAHLER
ncbi:MAG: polymerase sigma factor, sigma-70 family [Gemmatimonadetes bacterium]|nr:polymerase sigma factor, sigma-70 family [Gemmatimonadota bacterium]